MDSNGNQKDLPDLPHVVISGDPGAGFTITGPFLNFPTAINYTEQPDAKVPDSWWIMPVHPPNGTQKDYMENPAVDNLEILRQEIRLILLENGVRVGIESDQDLILQIRRLIRKP